MFITDFLRRRLSTTEIQDAAYSDAESLRFQGIAYQVAVGYIEEILAGCEFRVFEGGKSVQNAHWVALNYAPNPNLSAYELKRGWIHRYYYHNQAALVPLMNQLYLAEDFHVDARPMGEDQLVGVVIGAENSFQLNYPVRVSNAYVIRQRDKPILNLLRQMFLSYDTIMGYALAGYRATNGAKYVLDYSGYATGDDNFATLWKTRLQQQVKSFAEAQNGVFPQTKSLKLTQLGPSTTARKSADDLIALRKDAFAVVAEAFRLPVSLLEGNMTNIGDLFAQAMTACILPVAKMLSCELTRKTYSPSEISGGSRIVVDTTNCRYVDILTAAANADKLIASSVADTDEVRDLLGMEPIGEPWAKVHRITKNYELASNLTSAEGSDTGA